MTHQVRVVEYSPRWSDDFTSIVSFLRTHPQLVTTGIEHVGSTSVKGLAAKPVIDIDVIAKNASETQSLINALENLGYKHRGDLGISGREAFQTPATQKLPDHHLYVCIEGGIALRNHLLLRQILRKNKQLRTEYSELKKSLSQKYQNDAARYCEAKSNFIIKLLSQGGMPKEDLEVIYQENQL